MGELLANFSPKMSSLLAVVVYMTLITGRCSDARTAAITHPAATDWGQIGVNSDVQDNELMQPMLRRLWQLYEQQYPTNIPLRLPVLEHNTRVMDSRQRNVIGAECGSTQHLSPGTHLLRLLQISVPCVYQLKVAALDIITSLVCVDIFNATTSANQSRATKPTSADQSRAVHTTGWCDEDTLHVHHLEHTTTLYCGQRRLVSADHKQVMLRDQILFIECSIQIAEKDPVLNNGDPIADVPQPCPKACGHSRPDAPARIVGGTVATPGEFPWQAYILSKGFSTIALCGGSLINSRYVMSAGHCFKPDNWQSVAAVGVALGLFDTVKGPDANTQVSAAVRIVLHPNFSISREKGVINDISLVELANSILFTDRVGPVCLAEPGSLDISQSVVISGYGVTSATKQLGADPETAHYLKKVSAKLVPPEECKLIYEVLGLPVDSTTHLCTRGLLEEACSGDSGGPVMTKGSDGTYTQVGIVSFGIGCSDALAPSVNTRVSAYRGWVADTTSGGGCICGGP